MRPIFALPTLLVFLAAGCAQPQRSRSKYFIGAFDDLTVSDSPSIFSQPEKHPGRGATINQTILVQNHGLERPYQMQLDQAHFLVNGHRTPSVCRCHLKGPASANLMPSAPATRVDCTTEIKATPENELLSKDSTGTLVIPYGAAGGAAEKQIRVPYLVSIEDFR